MKEVVCNLTIETAVANQSGAMEADTISKNGRNLKSQMSKSNNNWYRRLVLPKILISLWNGYKRKIYRREFNSVL